MGIAVTDGWGVGTSPNLTCRDDRLGLFVEDSGPADPPLSDSANTAANDASRSSTGGCSPFQVFLLLDTVSSVDNFPPCFLDLGLFP